MTTLSAQMEASKAVYYANNVLIETAPGMYGVHVDVRGGVVVHSVLRGVVSGAGDLVGPRYLEGGGGRLGHRW